MRVAILVLGLIGSIMALALGACAGACAGVVGGMGEAIEQGVTEAAEQSEEGGLTEEQKAELQEGLAGADEAASTIGNVAMFAGAQGILGLIGCIMAFIALGKGDKATIGGVLILAAVVISLWAGSFPSIGISNILQLVAGILAFIAAPTVAAAAEA